MFSRKKSEGLQEKQKELTFPVILPCVWVLAPCAGQDQLTYLQGPAPPPVGNPALGSHEPMEVLSKEVTHGLLRNSTFLTTQGVDWGELPDWGLVGTLEILQAPEHPRGPEARQGTVEKRKRAGVPGVREQKPRVSVGPEGPSG